jgi:hypothetical protein
VNLLENEFYKLGQLAFGEHLEGKAYTITNDQYEAMSLGNKADFHNGISDEMVAHHQCFSKGHQTLTYNRIMKELHGRSLQKF